MFEQTVEALKKRGFEVAAVATKEEALGLVMKEAESAASVGWGGSESVKEIGARARLVESGKEIRDHQLVCDLFLLSANALTTDGRIVNIDGNGNRVAASICGPKRVVYVIGRNKIVDGGLDEAIARIRCCACPPNAKQTEFDCVYLSVIKDRMRSRFALSGRSLFSVTILESSASLISKIS